MSEPLRSFVEPLLLFIGYGCFAVGLVLGLWIVFEVILRIIFKDDYDGLF